MSFNWASLTQPDAPAELSTGAPAHAESTPKVRGQYDNARTTPENVRQWASVDYLSAKSANSAGIRRTLRNRSRYEVSNNPFLFGILNNNADDLVGDVGPTLQITTDDDAYNRMVEALWLEWSQEVELTEKIRSLKLAREVDGEGFLFLKSVPELEGPVKLFPLDIEADQVTTPAPANLTQLWIDGLTLHPATGRPISYHVLKSHPGDFFFPNLNPMEAEEVPAQNVIHWFRKFRPGQVRGVPVFTSSLDLFTELRAFRRAVLGAAEIAADFAAVLEQDRVLGANNVDDDDDEYTPFKRTPISRKMMTMLPPGTKLSQLDAKHPSTTYEMFQQVCLGEACRPLSYPLNLALGTSQKFNFSSAKLDHTNYRGSITTERGQCEAKALNRLFRQFFTEAVLCGALPRRIPGNGLPPHEWHWPGFEPLDPVADATADHERLAHGTDTYRRFWASRGRDWRDMLKQQADERKEITRLNLEFGDPVKRTQTETENNTEPTKGAPDNAE